MKKRLFWLCLLCTVWFPSQGDAQEAIPFTVTPVHSDIQNPKVTSYFDLSIRKRVPETVWFYIQNTTDEPVVVSVEPLDSVSNENYTISYEKRKADATEYELDKNLVIDETIRLKPKEGKRVAMRIEPPKDKEYGTHLAAVSFSKQEKPVAIEGDDTSVQLNVQKELQIIIAVQLNVERNEKEHVVWGKRAVEGSKKEKIRIPVVNQNRAIARDSFRYHLLKETGKTEKTVEENVIGYAMAPVSSVNYPIVWENPLSAGRYHVDIYDAKGVFINRYSFEVVKEADQMLINTEKDGYSTDEEGFFAFGKDKKKWWLFALGGAAAIGLIWLLWLWKRKKKPQKQEDEKEDEKPEQEKKTENTELSDKNSENDQNFNHVD